MKIRIDHKYIIEKDDYSYTVKEDKHKKDKEGRDIMENIAYYSNIEGAVEKVMRLRIEDRNAEKEISLYEYITELKLENEKFKEILKGEIL